MTPIQDPQRVLVWDLVRPALWPAGFARAGAPSPVKSLVVCGQAGRPDSEVCVREAVVWRLPARTNTHRFGAVPPARGAGVGPRLRPGRCLGGVLVLPWRPMLFPSAEPASRGSLVPTVVAPRRDFPPPSAVLDECPMLSTVAAARTAVVPSPVTAGCSVLGRSQGRAGRAIWWRQPGRSGCCRTGSVRVQALSPAWTVSRPLRARAPPGRPSSLMSVS